MRKKPSVGAKYLDTFEMLLYFQIHYCCIHFSFLRNKLFTRLGYLWTIFCTFFGKIVNFGNRTNVHFLPNNHDLLWYGWLRFQKTEKPHQVFANITDIWKITLILCWLMTTFSLGLAYDYILFEIVGIFIISSRWSGPKLGYRKYSTTTK